MTSPQYAEHYDIDSPYYTPMVGTDLATLGESDQQEELSKALRLQQKAQRSVWHVHRQMTWYLLALGILLLVVAAFTLLPAPFALLVTGVVSIAAALTVSIARQV